MYYLKRMKQFFFQKKSIYPLLFSALIKSQMGRRTHIELSGHSYIHEGPPFCPEATYSDNLKVYHFILLHKVKVQLEVIPHSYVP
jgi:hypothetical protein